MLNALLQQGHTIEIWSGREATDRVLQDTKLWLTDSVRPDWEDCIKLRMRDVGKFLPDDRLKKAWINEVTEGGDEIDFVFDDRDSMVSFWREMGIPCFQVAPGAF